MLESIITTKGRTTVPQPFRDALRILPGTKLVWHLMPDGSITVRAKNKSILDLVGRLKAPANKKVRVGDMNAWR